MAEQIVDAPWILKHDPFGDPITLDTIVAFDDVFDIVTRMSMPEPDKRYRASGSHWALSTAAIADNIAIETNFPGDDAPPKLSGPAIDLGEIATAQFVDYLWNHRPTVATAIMSDPCLATPFTPFYVHLKSGTRIYEAYSLLDRDDSPIKTGKLVQLIQELYGDVEGAFNGPWAFQTLGGAGGQTVFGALTTGTHGGDYRQRPISDCVAALHLVAHGGQQYWIEASGERQPVPIADEFKLQDKYPRAKRADGSFIKDKIKVIRDSDMLDAVTVAAGRFGVVTSIVVTVVPQYCLHEHRQLTDWSIVKAGLLSASRHHVFDNIFFSPPGAADKAEKFKERYGAPPEMPNRFLQIAVNVSPHANNEHRCGVTQRWWVAANAPGALDENGHVPGREQRGTLQTAGNSYPYDPPDEDHPGQVARSTGTFLEKACSNQNFFAGLIDALEHTITEITTKGFVPGNSLALTALGVGAGAAVTALGSELCPALAAAIAILEAVKAALAASGKTSLASAVYETSKQILNGVPRPLALMILRCAFLQVFEMEQSDRDYVAISYAVMDGHDYHDQSCFGDADSIEVFFDARDPSKYCTYIDQILAFEAAQQASGIGVTVGYVSLRYVLGSHALISPSRWPETLVIEIAQIRNQRQAPFVDNAARLARNPMFAAPFHWGQRNPLTALEVEQIFNATPRPGALDLWRRKLRQILSDHDVKEGFSSTFTRQTGLEPM